MKNYTRTRRNFLSLAVCLILPFQTSFGASTIKSSYGTSNQTITCTITSLVNGNARASTAVDNTTNLFLDALVAVKVKSNASGTGAAGYVNVYAYGTADGGTTYTQSATGTDAGITLTVPPNARLIGTINVVANAVTYNGGPFAVSGAFGGVLPDHWGIIVENQSGATLDASVGSSWYQGILAQTI